MARAAAARPRIVPSKPATRGIFVERAALAPRSLFQLLAFVADSDQVAKEVKMVAIQQRRRRSAKSVPQAGQRREPVLVRGNLCVDCGRPRHRREGHRDGCPYGVTGLERVKRYCVAFKLWCVGGTSLWALLATVIALVAVGVAGWFLVNLVMDYQGSSCPDCFDDVRSPGW